MLGRLSRSLVAFAALACAAGAPPVLAQQPAIVNTRIRQTVPSKRLRQGAAYSATAYGRKGAGISMARQQRAARKARNVARNRAAHR